METIEFSPEIRFLEQVIRKYIREQEELDRLPRLDRLMENYRLLLPGKRGGKCLDDVLAKQLGAAVLYHASGMPAEVRQEFFRRYKIEGFSSHAADEIEFALEDCLRMKKSYAESPQEVTRSRNVLGSLLSLLVHMDDLGEDIGLMAAFEKAARAGVWDIYGQLPASQLTAIADSKQLKDSTEALLRSDGSVVALALLLIGGTRYYLAPVESYLNADIRAEIIARRFELKTETEKIIERKRRNEKSLAR